MSENRHPHNSPSESTMNDTEPLKSPPNVSITSWFGSIGKQKNEKNTIFWKNFHFLMNTKVGYDIIFAADFEKGPLFFRERQKRSQEAVTSRKRVVSQS